MPANARWLRMISERGHEVGNHSFHHECWLHRYTPEMLADELATGRRRDRRGHRPADRPASAARASAGARHCSRRWRTAATGTTRPRCPTYLGPLARAYFLATARLTPEQRRERGTALRIASPTGLRPAGAYQWQLCRRAEPAGDPGDDDAGDQDAVPHELPDLPQPLLTVTDAQISARRAGAVPARGRRAELPVASARRARAATTRHSSRSFRAWTCQEASSASWSGKCFARWPSSSRWSP